MSDNERYMKAAHAMQSGVAMDQSMGSNDGTPKHLRVGVNSAQVATAALARLLIAKGIITLAEYECANADEMEAEVKRYEAKLTAQLGRPVTLA